MYVQSDEIPIYLKDEGAVVLGPLLIESEEVDSKSRLGKTQFRESETFLKERIISTVLSVLSDKKINTKMYQDYETEVDVNAFSNFIIRENADLNKSKQYLSKYCETPNSVFLVHKLFLRFGNRAGVSVNPMILGTGLGVAFAPTSNTNSTYYKLVLRSCESGDVVWKNDFFVRKTPEAGDERFFELVEDLVKQINKKR